MGRIPCCEKDNVKRGQWTPEEDNKLSSYISQHGTRNWRLIPKNAGLQRCGKSCRLRWTNYLRPDLKHGDFSPAEEQTIIKLHAVVGNRWSLIAAQLPGRTDNDVKNYWNTKLKKRLSGMGIDPVTHKPFSHLMAEIATTLAPPQVAHLTEAALGCFKDEMLHLLTKKRIDFQLQPAAPQVVNTVENMKMGFSSLALMSTSSTSTNSSHHDFPSGDCIHRFHYVDPTTNSFGSTELGDHMQDGSPWNQTQTVGDPARCELDRGIIHETKLGIDHEGKKLGSDHERINNNGTGSSSLFGSDSGLWDELMINPTI